VHGDEAWGQDGSPKVCATLVLSDEVWDVITRQFGSLDVDSSGAIDAHEVSTRLWAELETHFNEDGDDKINRREYVRAVTKAILTKPLVVATDTTQRSMQEHLLVVLERQANEEALRFLHDFAHRTAALPGAEQSSPHRPENPWN
jgi:hypothetical protein